MPQNAELYHTCMLQAGLSPANPNPDPSLSPSLSPSPSLRSRSRLRHNPNPRSNPNQMCNFLPEANKRQDLPPLHAESAMAPRLARRLDHRPLSRRTHATHATHATHVSPHTTEEGKAEPCARTFCVHTACHCMYTHVMFHIQAAAAALARLHAARHPGRRGAVLGLRRGVLGHHGQAGQTQAVNEPRTVSVELFSVRTLSSYVREKSPGEALGGRDGFGLTP